MGIKIKELIDEEKASISDFKGKIVAIDAPNIIFRLFSFSYNRRDRWKRLMVDRTQRAISHLYGLLYRVRYLYQKRIFPIFCFDGKESELKGSYGVGIDKFRSQKSAYERALTNGHLSQAKKIALGSGFFWKHTLDESKQLLHAMGVPVVISPSSAEAQCAELVKHGIAAYSNSFDYDSLLYGCPRIVKNLNKTRKRKVPGKNVYYSIPIRVIDLEKNLARLNLDRFQLIDIALLVGIDYFEGVKGIGAKTAYNLIKRYKDLVGVARHKWDEYRFRLDRERLQTLREIFLFPDVTMPDKVMWNPPNEAKIFDLLLHDHTLSPKRVKSHTDRLYSDFKRCLSYFRGQNKVPRMVQTTLF